MTLFVLITSASERLRSCCHMFVTYSSQVCHMLFTYLSHLSRWEEVTSSTFLHLSLCLLMRERAGKRTDVCLRSYSTFLSALRWDCRDLPVGSRYKHNEPEMKREIMAATCIIFPTSSCRCLHSSIMLSVRWLHTGQQGRGQPVTQWKTTIIAANL